MYLVWSFWTTRETECYEVIGFKKNSVRTEFPYESITEVILIALLDQQSRLSGELTNGASERYEGLQGARWLVGARANKRAVRQVARC